MKKEKREYEEKKKCSRELSSLLVDKRRQIINNAPVYVYFMRGRPRILIGFVGIVAVVVILVELFFSSEAQKLGEYRTTVRVKQPPAILHSFSQRTTRSNRNRGSKLGKDTLVQSRSTVFRSQARIRDIYDDSYQLFHTKNTSIRVSHSFFFQRSLIQNCLTIISECVVEPDAF